ncbi:hypothetical protein [Pseudomonas cremoricolorata]|uniref:Uncharacterized protein n=1 Tax=Pseudomonas cremoricolorata TaxID=157783 RepID=A0A089WPL6_9PSED|nr:hypothetical protein [Pseudomonas cremoricolorata]AIR89094.1 hypothetical protein LK03_07325 [Pseudomonas cremoricolorata]
MHGPRQEEDEHSTLEPDPRPKARRRMLLSLVLFGVLVGLMIGRLTTTQPSQLEQIEVVEAGLDLWFDHAPKLHGEHVQGTLALLFDAHGKAARGQLQMAGKPVAWRVQQADKGLLLTLVAARPLRGSWTAAEEEAGRWRVQVRLHE